MAGVRKSLEEVEVGTHFLLEPDESRHAVKAMRLRDGEALDVVDGSGCRVRAKVDKASDPLVVVATDVVQEPASRPRLVLVQGLAKGGRDEQAVETATELGVDVVVPWQAVRSVSRWDRKKAEAGPARWRRVAEAATKQSRRSWTPKVHTPMSAAEVAALLAAEGAFVLVLHESADTGLGDVLRESGELADADVVALVVGPEGGITAEELSAFEEIGARVVRAGENVMRSSTAGPAVMAALNFHLERW